MCVLTRFTGRMCNVKRYYYGVGSFSRVLIPHAYQISTVALSWARRHTVVTYSQTPSWCPTTQTSHTSRKQGGGGRKVEDFASHSLRRGGVSAAWQCEVGRELLKGHGRWSSDAIDLYLQASVETKLTVTASN
jgi:hypothetical protein